MGGSGQIFKFWGACCEKERWRRKVRLASLMWWSRERLSAITFNFPEKCWEYMEESAEMKRVAGFLAMAAWKDRSADMKFDLWSHPQDEELSVRESIQLWGVKDPSRISTQHPNMEAGIPTRCWILGLGRDVACCSDVLFL